VTSCKKELKVKACIERQCIETLARYHPRGCMKAKQDHLDLLSAPQILAELARKRGIKLECIEDPPCVILIESLLGIEVRVCPDSGTLKCGEPKAYLMRSKSKNIYIGNVVYEEQFSK